MAVVGALTGLPVPTDDQIARDAAFESPLDTQEQGRQARFRLRVMAAYNYTCALSRYRLTTITGKSVVDAAHIHQFADSRNNARATAWPSQKTPTGSLTMAFGR